MFSSSQGVLAFRPILTIFLFSNKKLHYTQIITSSHFPQRKRKLFSQHLVRIFLNLLRGKAFIRAFRGGIYHE